MGPRRRRLVRQLGRPAPLPARARRRPRAAHPGAREPARRPLRRRRPRPRRRDDRLRARAPPRAVGRRGRERDRPARRARRPASRRCWSAARTSSPHRACPRTAARWRGCGGTTRRCRGTPPSWSSATSARGEELVDRGRPRRVGAGAAVERRRRAVVRLRPQRLVEPLPLHGPARDIATVVRVDAEIGVPHVAVRRRRATRCSPDGSVVFARLRRGYDGARPARSRRHGHRAGHCRSPRVDRGARRARTARCSSSRARPTAGAGRAPGRPEPGAWSRRCARRATWASTPAYISVPEHITFPQRRRPHRARAVLPARPPRAVRARRASCRRCSWRSTAARRPQRRRCSPRPCSTGPAAGSPSSTSTTAARPATAARSARSCCGQWGIVDVADCLAAARHLARTRPGRRGAARHPRRLGGRVHHARRAGPRRHAVRGGRRPLRRRRPRGARPRHAQVREPLPRRAGRPVPGRRATSTSSGPRSTTSTASPGR